MELTTQTKTPSPVEITEDIKVSLNRLGRELETHAESGIRIGKELIHLKEITPHGKFGELVEWAYGLKEHTRTNYMNVAEKFGENCSRLQFSNQVLIELSRPSVPDSAREAALAEESLTVKQAKDLAEAHKRIAELESGKVPDVNNLIPELQKKYKGASITIGAAHRLSVLDVEQQKLFLTFLESKQFAESKNQQLSSEKLRALEDLNKAIKERDALKQQIEEIASTDTASVLLEKEEALREAQREFDRKLIKMRQELSKEASELHEKRFYEQITKAEDAKVKAEKKAKAEQDRAKAAWDALREREIEIKKLKEQMEVDNPTNIDNARLRHIEDAGRGLMVAINALQKDMDRIGGGMEQSIDALNEVLKSASLEAARLQGMQNAIITI